MKKIKPLFDYLLIKPLEKETTLPSGIVIPDSAKEKPQEGEVIAVGPGAKDKDGNLNPMEVEVGQVVMYKKWGGTEVQVGGEDHVLARQEDILAVLED
jgi:chaperonin GroES